MNYIAGTITNKRKKWVNISYVNATAMHSVALLNDTILSMLFPHYLWILVSFKNNTFDFSTFDFSILEKYTELIHARAFVESITSTFFCFCFLQRSIFFLFSTSLYTKKKKPGIRRMPSNYRNPGRVFQSHTVKKIEYFNWNPVLFTLEVLVSSKAARAHTISVLLYHYKIKI